MVASPSDWEINFHGGMKGLSDNRARSFFRVVAFELDGISNGYCLRMRLNVPLSVWQQVQQVLRSKLHFHIFHTYIILHSYRN